MRSGFYWHGTCLGVACFTWMTAAKLVAAEIEVFRGNGIEVYRGATVTNAPSAQPVQEVRSSSATNGVKTGQMEVFQAEGVTLRKPGGIDPVQKPGAFEKALAGRWTLQIPGVAYQTERDLGHSIERKLHTGAGAGFGVLTIKPNGTYAWKVNGKQFAGKFREVVPRNDAEPGVRYWLFEREKEAFYLRQSSRNEVSVYTAVNSFVAQGTRSRRE